MAHQEHVEMDGDGWLFLAEMDGDGRRFGAFPAEIYCINTARWIDG